MQGLVRECNSIGKECQGKTRTACDDCVGLGLMMKGIFLGLSNLTTLQATNSIISKLKSDELALTRPFNSVSIPVLPIL